MFRDYGKDIDRLERKLDKLVEALGGEFAYVSDNMGVSLGSRGKLGELDENRDELHTDLYKLANVLGYERQLGDTWIKTKKGGK